MSVIFLALVFTFNQPVNAAPCLDGQVPIGSRECPPPPPPRMQQAEETKDSIYLVFEKMIEWFNSFEF